MLIKIGASLSVMALYIQGRGETYQFYIRVPVHLHGHYGKTRIRQSLNTKNERDAMREGEKLARKYQAEFKALSQGVGMTPTDTTLAGKALAEQGINANPALLLLGFVRGGVFHGNVCNQPRLDLGLHPR